MKEVNKNAQVWVETVIYTLIALVMIGLVLSFAKPKIEEFQDKATIEQSIKMMGQIDSVIREIDQRGVGNQRTMQIELKDGSLKINGVNDKLVFEITSRYQYSEEDSDYSEGDITINTEKKGELNLVSLTIEYGLRYDLTYQLKDNLKTIDKASVPYDVKISNNGAGSDGRIKINFEVN